MANYTLSYSESSQGWPSFYSFNPDYMVGMNNYFYSFKGGNLYRHNVNETRNNFYGVQYTSKVVSVFNMSALENKIFKTLNLEGNSGWATLMETDIQTSGFIGMRRRKVRSLLSSGTQEQYRLIHLSMLLDQSMGLA
jgi:hypothetical protein